MGVGQRKLCHASNEALIQTEGASPDVETEEGESGKEARRSQGRGVSVVRGKLGLTSGRSWAF